MFSRSLRSLLNRSKQRPVQRTPRVARMKVELLEDRVVPANFTPGDIVVEQVGTGSAAASSAATAVFLNEYTPSGVLVQSIALPTAVSGSNNPLTSSGSATSEGLLTLSTNGQYLLVPGYDVAPGEASVASTSTTAGTPAAITGATNASPIVLTVAAAPASDTLVTIAGVGGNTAANGTWFADKLTTTTFALYQDAAFTNPVVGNGTYTSGGTWAAVAVPREVGEVNTFGSINTTTTTTEFSANNIRSVASTDGTSLWMTGANSGVIYNTLGGSGAGTVVSTTVTNLREAGIYGGQLFVSTSSGSTVRLGTVGTGTPTSTGNTITDLPGFETSTGSPYAFFFANLGSGNNFDSTGMDTVYVADSSLGIQKWSYNGTTWTETGSVATSTPFEGITGVVNGTTVTLYATNNNGQLETLVDSSGAGGTLTGTPTVIATATTNTNFRGVVGAPSASLTATSEGTPSSNNNPAPTSSSVTLTATVSTNLNGQTVYFEEVVNGAFTQIGSGTVSGGRVSTTYTTPATGGTYSIYAYYPGSSTLNASYSATPLSLVVGTPSAPVFTAGSTDSATFAAGLYASVADPATGNPSTISYAVTAGTLPAGVTLNASSGTLSGEPSAGAGVYIFTITATNTAGSTNQTFTLTVTGVAGVATNSAGIETTGPYTGPGYIDIAGTSATYPSFGVFNYSVTPPRTNATSLSSLDVQFYEDYYAADDLGGTADLYLATTSVANSALKYQAGYNGYAGIDPQLSVIGLDGGTAPIAQASYTPSSANTGILNFNITSSILSANPTLASTLLADLQNGSLWFVVVSDTAAAGYQVAGSSGSPAPGINITYNYTNPIITSANSAAFSLTAGEPNYFQVTADATPAATFTESGNLPSGVTLTTAGLLSGTPTTPGVFPITITATSGSLTTTQSFTLTVFATSASAFTAGNLLANLVPTTGTAGNAGQTDLFELTPSGTAVQAVALPSTGSSAFTETVGPTRPEGFLTDASDGHSVEIAGFNVAAGTSTNGANATIAVIEPNGTINYSTQIPTADITDPKTSTSAVYAVASADGDGFYVATDDFIQYVPFGNSSSTATSAVTNFFTANDGTSGGYESTQSPFDVAISGSDVTNSIQLYGDAGSQAQTDGVPAADGPFSIGTGLPTTGGQSAVVYGGPSTGTDANGSYTTSEQFSFSPDGTTFIVADARTDGFGGLYEYQESISGTSFALVGSYTYTNAGLTGLSVNWNNSDTPSAIYAVTTTKSTADTSANEIVSFSAPPSGDNESATSNQTIVATAPAGYTFTGVAMTPVAAVTTPTTITTLSVSGSGGQYSTVGLSATVTSGGNPVNGGYVSFLSGTTEIGSAPVVGGTATLTPDTNFLAGSYTNLTAVYTGTSSYAASTSSPASSATVAKYATTETITDSAGGTVSTTTPDTLTDTLNVPAGTVPTGTIQFYDNGTAIGSPVAVAQVISGGVISFSASYTYTFTTTGTADVTAAYSGDSNFAAITQANSPVYPINVVNGTTTVVTSNQSDPSGNGASITYTATVTGNAAAGVPTGTVQFYVNGVAVGSPVNLTGASSYTATATYTLSTSLTETQPGTVTPGVDSISATYTPTNNYAASTGAFNQTVQTKAFGVGDQLIYQTGDGTTTNFGAETADIVYIDDFSGTTLVQQIVMPSVTANGYNAFTQQGSNGAAGFITATSSGNGWVFGGQLETLGSTSGTAVLAFLSVNGTVTDNTIDTTSQGYTIRSVASVDGAEFWIGTSSNVYYIAGGTDGAATALTTGVTPRTVEIAPSPTGSGNQLYVSSATAGYYGVSTVGTGLPTTTGQTVTLIANSATTAYGPYDFKFAELKSADGFSVDTLYIVNDYYNGSTAGGVEKWSYVSGAWTLTSYNAVGTSSTNEDGGLAVSVSNGVATLYVTENIQFGATTGGSVEELVDNTGYNDASGNFNTLTPTAGPSLSNLPSATDSNVNWHGIALVGTAATTTTVTSNNSDANASGASITLTATITSADGTPTGTVQFYDNLIPLGSPVTVNSSGVATLTVATALTQTTGDLTPGIHSITANFVGSGPFSSSSNVINQVVKTQSFGFSDQLTYRFGDGVTPLNNVDGVAVYVDEYSPTGTLVQSIAMPTADALGTDGNYYHALVQEGTSNTTGTGASNPSQFGGQVSLSGNGQYAFLGGYDSNPLTATTDPFQANSERSIARIAANGTISIETINNAVDTLSVSGSSSYQSDPTGVYSPDGNQVWLAGTEVFGLLYLSGWSPGQTTQPATQIWSNISTTNYINELGLEGNSGNLYMAVASSGSSVNPYENIVNLGSFSSLTTAGALSLTATSGAGSVTNLLPTHKYYTDVYFASPTLLYAAYESGSSTNAYGNGGIAKYSYNGTAWTLEGTAITGSTDLNGTTPISGSGYDPGFIFLSGSGGPGNVTLYSGYTYEGTIASGVTALTGQAYHLTDTNGATSGFSSTTPTTIVTDTTGSTYVGLEFHGVADVPVATPTVTSVSPALGPVGGGTSVTITGTNFTPGSTVYFGSTAATSVTVTSATSITAVDPAESAGTVDITVTTQSGTTPTSSADKFTYQAVTSLSLVDNGPNPSTYGQAVSFAVQLSSYAGTITGETVNIEDASNSNAVVGSGTLNSSGAATITISTLSVGSHNLFAVYGGDTLNEGSQSSQTTQVVTNSNPVTVSSVNVDAGTAPVISASESGTTVTITTGGTNGFSAGDPVVLSGVSSPNGYDGTYTIATVSPSTNSFTINNFPTTGLGTVSNSGTATDTALTDSGLFINGTAGNGHSASYNSQRSMVDSIVYTFNQAVNIGSGGFTIAVHSGDSDGGTAPSLSWASPNGGTTWVVTFSGSGVVGNSIANGVYDITLNSSAVSAVSGGGTLASSETDTFYRLFGDINGDERVNSVDYAAFNPAYNSRSTGSTAAAFVAAFDANGDGRVNSADYSALNPDYNVRYTGFTRTI